ncbi:UROD/MetE-like protein [Trametopsis cervina]|nr:UROD/MetE-like protein [Trametopsis cervina]
MKPNSTLAWLRTSAQMATMVLPAASAESATSHLHLNPPHRAEHIGSLLRPAALLEKRAQFEAKLCTSEDLNKAEDEAIKDAVALQKELGLKTITDGEMRRGAYYEGMFELLEGMEVIVRPIETFKSYLPYVQFWLGIGLPAVPTVYTSGKIKWRAPGIHTKEFEYLKSLVPPQDVKNLKITLSGPTWMHMRHGPEETYDHSVYKNDDEYFADLIQAFREEIRALYSLGCRFIQFDDPTFAFYCAESTVTGMKEAGVDSEKLLDQYIKLFNAILEDRPADLTVALHTCRGNYKGIHFCSGGYDPIAYKLFNDLNIDVYYLEYDTERAGTFAPLKFVPLNKAVVLGLVTSKHGELETVEEIQELVEEACDTMLEGPFKRSRAYALNQICISPQCGFASVAEGNPITHEDQRQKLSLVVRAAKQTLE